MSCNRKGVLGIKPSAYLAHEKDDDDTDEHDIGFMAPRLDALLTAHALDGAVDLAHEEDV